MIYKTPIYYSLSYNRLCKSLLKHHKELNVIFFFAEIKSIIYNIYPHMYIVNQLYTIFKERLLEVKYIIKIKFGDTYIFYVFILLKIISL